MGALRAIPALLGRIWLETVEIGAVLAVIAGVYLLYGLGVALIAGGALILAVCVAVELTPLLTSKSPVEDTR